MAYEKQTWVAYETPVGAARLNHMEDGLEAVAAQADTLAKDMTGLAEGLGEVQEVLTDHTFETTLNPADFEPCYWMNTNTGAIEYSKYSTAHASNNKFLNYPYAVFIEADKIPAETTSGMRYILKLATYDADGNKILVRDFQENYDGVRVAANTNFRLNLKDDTNAAINLEEACAHYHMSYEVPGLEEQVAQLRNEMDGIKDAVEDVEDDFSVRMAALTQSAFDPAAFEACYPINTSTGVREYGKYSTSVASNGEFFVADVDMELFSDVAEGYQFVCVVYSKSGMFVKTYDYADTTEKITLPAGTRYRLQIRKNGVSTIDVNDVCRHIYMSSVMDSVRMSASRLAECHNEDIVDFNNDILPAVYASSRYGCHGLGKENFKKKYSLLVTTDLHKSDQRLTAAIEYLNAIPSLDAGCCLGDIQGGDFTENDGTWYTNRVNCSNKPFYTVLGNHDFGNTTTASKCGTDAEVLAKFITPTEGKIGIAGLTTPYYSFKNDAHKLYFIVLNNYDSPETLDGSGNYAFYRGGECFRQAQIDWLISQLGAVPSDYKLVVMMHSFPYPNTPHECKFTEDGYVLAGNTVSAFNPEDNIIPSIVDAWQRGASLSKTVNPVSEYAGVVEALNISANFTSRGAGNFICYLVGHVHNDIVSHSTTYPNQLAIGFCSSASGNFQNASSDLPRVPETKTEDAITVVSFDTDAKHVNLVRVGSNVTYNMTRRDFEGISYT